MPRSFIICLFIAAMACNDDNDSHSDSVLRAASKCGQSPLKMQWLDDLIRESQRDVALSGNIYAVSVDGNVVFIHQPAVMSCLACVMYDCDGNRIDGATVDLQKIINLMSPAAVIYSPY